MAEHADPEPLDLLRDLIVAHDPSLAESSFRLTGAGWDSTAVDVDGRLIFKFPKDEEAEAALVREARLLSALRPALTLALPDLQILEGPRVFSRHERIEGEHLLPPDYVDLPEAARARLAEDLARFFAELHAIPPDRMRAVGAGPVEAWLPPEEIARRALPLLSPEMLEAAGAMLDAYAALGPDPLGEAFGHFDAHGWNMAFDHGAQRLNGLFDFGDAGIGPLHREFVQTSLVAPGLSHRAASAYERMTGRTVDRERVWCLTGAHRLWELAVEADDPEHAPVMARAVVEWLAGDAGSSRP